MGPRFRGSASSGEQASIAQLPVHREHDFRAARQASVLAAPISAEPSQGLALS
jgi:hypothetical protein